MIFQVPSLNPPQILSWSDKLKRDIYVKNLNRVRNDVPPSLPPPLSLDKLFTSPQLPLTLPQPQHPSFYSPYSTYIPLHVQCKFSDQICNTFPYISHTQQRGFSPFLYQQIAERLRQSEDTQSLWRQTLTHYICTMDCCQAIDQYIGWLKHGLRSQQSTACCKEVVVQRVLSAQKWLQRTINTSEMLGSMLAGQVVSEATIGKTMKALFCNLCCMYDCGVHMVDHKLFFTKQFQYVAPNNKVSKDKLIGDAVRIAKVHYNIRMNSSNSNGKCCGNKCYLLLDRSALEKTQHLHSPILKSLLNIGIEMFSYDPCKVSKYSKVECSTVFLYLVAEHNLMNRIEYKLCASEEEMLQREWQFETREIRCTRQREKKKTKVTGCCYHHFVNQQSIDVYCMECPCHQRKYCLPQCLCDRNCPLKKKGCVCKRDNCRTSNCPCFMADEECKPDVCGNCERRGCRNKQILCKEQKLVRVGVSTMVGAGLGGFAGEWVRKGDLVCIYTGQIIHEDVDRIRETFACDLSFYNFGSPQGTIDARFMGSKSRFINHADNNKDNLDARIFFTGGKHVIGLFARRNIEIGEELLFDYDGEGELYRNHKHKYPFIQKKISL